MDGIWTIMYLYNCVDDWSIHNYTNILFNMEIRVYPQYLYCLTDNIKLSIL